MTSPPSRGRPSVIDLDSTVRLDATKARTTLQSESDRRAVVNHLIDSGGAATVRLINAHFGFDTRKIILSLRRNGWIKLEGGQPS